MTSRDYSFLENPTKQCYFINRIYTQIHVVGTQIEPYTRTNDTCQGKRNARKATKENVGCAYTVQNLR